MACFGFLPEGRRCHIWLEEILSRLENDPWHGVVNPCHSPTVEVKGFSLGNGDGALIMAVHVVAGDNGVSPFPAFVAVLRDGAEGKTLHHGHVYDKVSLEDADDGWMPESADLERTLLSRPGMPASCDTGTAVSVVRDELVGWFVTTAPYVPGIPGMARVMYGHRRVSHQADMAMRYRAVCDCVQRHVDFSPLGTVKDVFGREKPETPADREMADIRRLRDAMSAAPFLAADPTFTDYSGYGDTPEEAVECLVDIYHAAGPDIAYGDAGGGKYVLFDPEEETLEQVMDIDGHPFVHVVAKPNPLLR